MSNNTVRGLLPAMAVVLAAAGVVFAADGPKAVKLQVADRRSAPRAAEAVCSGIPFARGVLRPETAMHVEAPEGIPLPTQTRVLGRWPDGSVRWLLVQFLADCPANARREYSLVPGPAPEPAVKLSIDEEPDQLLIDTGAIRATVPKSDLTVLGNVWRVADGGNEEILAGGTPMTFVLEDGTVHTSSGVVPDSVAVEEDGPVRATIRVTGWLEGPGRQRLYKLDARLRFYAGQSYIRGDYTFICLGKPELHLVNEVRLELSPKLGKASRFLLPGECRGTLSRQRPAVLEVDRNMAFRVSDGGESPGHEGPLDGWAVVADEISSLGVAIRDFGHLNPKAIELLPGKITLALWSRRAGETLKLGRTRAKTHRVLFDFRGAADETLSHGRDARATRLRAFQEPLIAGTTPGYSCSTDALGTLSPAGAAQTAAYDKTVREMFETLHGQRQTLPLENGMLHYGDYYHGGYGNKATRGDLEYDTGHACFLLYARSGDRDYYNFAVACNQHFIDMDVNWENGHQRFHGYGDRAETHQAVTTALEWGHVFTDCPADAYYLTGDERSLQALGMIADAVATIADGEGTGKLRGIFAGAERQLGWPLAALCRAYEVTGEKRYLRAATKIVEYVKSYAKDPPAAYREGTWWRCWMMDGCKPFMVGALHDGLSAYYAITGDEELRQAIVVSLDWLIDHMWHPETGGFVYEYNAFNRRHRLVSKPDLNMLVVDAFRFGYEMTGDRRYLAVAMRAFQARVQEMTAEVDGKQFSQDTRTAPFTAAYFQRENIMPDRLPPAPEPIKQAGGPTVLQPRPEVLLRADFEGDLECDTPQGAVPRPRCFGEQVGKITFVPGQQGKAFRVGTGGYAWLPAPAEMLRGPGSIELWVRLHFKKRPTSPGQRAIFHVEGQTPMADSLAACTIYNELRIRMKDHVGCLNGTAEGDIAAWEPEQWHHVVVTWNQDRVKLYLDGKEQLRSDEGQQAWDGVADFPAGEQTKINLGWRFGNWYCPCDVDNLTIYGRALSTDEIAAGANKPSR